MIKTSAAVAEIPKEHMTNGSEYTEKVSRPVMRHFIWLDWLRFAAAFMVLLVHTRGFAFAEFGQLEPASQTKLAMLLFVITRIGHEAVIVFFVLSGFLVGGKIIERVSQRTFEWRSYFVDRTSRIVLPMVPAILLAVAIDSYFGHPVPLNQLLGNMFFLQGSFFSTINTIVPLWSLAYEVWFYILAAALAVAVMSRPKPQPVALIILFISLALFTKLSAVYLFCWFIGALVYLYPRKDFSRLETSLSVITMGVGIAIYQLSTKTNAVQVSGWLGKIANAPIGELVISAGIAILIRNLCTVTENERNASFLGGLGTKLAAFSYTLYLVHYPILKAMRYMGYESDVSLSRGLPMFLVRVLACLIISYAFYWLFERNTPILRRYLQKLF